MCSPTVRTPPSCFNCPPQLPPSNAPHPDTCSHPHNPTPNIRAPQEAARCYDRAAIHRHLRSWLHADACPASAVASDEGPAGGASKPRAHRRSPPLNLNFPIETYADDLIWAAKTGLDDIALTFRHESTGEWPSL